MAWSLPCVQRPCVTRLRTGNYGQEHPGRFLGHEPALTKGGAEALYNVKKWNNPLDTLHEYS